MTKLSVANGCIIGEDKSHITDLAIVVKADEGKVLDCGNYEVMAFLCEHAMPINGWDMRALRIDQEHPYTAVYFVEQLSNNPDKCLRFIRSCESGEPMPQTEFYILSSRDGSELNPPEVYTDHKSAFDAMLAQYLMKRSGFPADSYLSAQYHIEPDNAYMEDGRDGKYWRIDAVDVAAVEPLIGKRRLSSNG